MRPSPTTAAPRAGPRSPKVAAKLLSLALALGVAGCAQFERDSERLARQVQEATCVSHCQGVKEQCDDNARFDYQQCQAGYQAAQRDFRWCNAADEEHCGYPWWSCSENLYGYCTNRLWECRSACRNTYYQGRGPAGSGSAH
jgi:hypothetical protein